MDAVIKGMDGLAVLLIIKNKCNIFFFCFFLKKLRPRNEQRENELIISFLRGLYEEKQKVHMHLGEIKQVWHFSPIILAGDCVKQEFGGFYEALEPVFVPVFYFHWLYIWGEFGIGLGEGEFSVCIVVGVTRRL